MANPLERPDLVAQSALCSCSGGREWSRLLAGRDVLLTTYCPDGASKSVHVWGYPNEGRLLVWTSPASWKVRRIKADAHVVLTTCTCRGHTIGLGVQATARILTSDESRRLYEVVARRTGTLGRVTALNSGIRDREATTVGLEFTRSQ